MKKLYTWLVVLMIAPYSGAMAQNSVTSMSLAGGNGSSGVTFNVNSTQTVDIDSIGVALYAGTVSQNVEVWYNTSPINGQPTVSTTNGWVLHDIITVNNITGAFTNPNQFTLVLTSTIQIPAGQTYGFYVGSASGTSVAYTSWLSTNQDTFTDGTVTLTTGQNVGYGGTPTNPLNHPRQFNGTIYYSNPVFTPWDAGVTFIAPPTVCSGLNTVTAGIKNYGDSVLNSLTVNWTLNGILQTPISFIGTLDTAGGTGVTVDTVTLGAVNFPNNVTTTIKAWTTDLNGLNPDTVNWNDTVTVAIQPSMAGVYTIGGIGGDFPSFTAAVNGLNMRGVCDDVTFNVATGVYNEQISIGSVAGVNDTNTIHFRSASLDSSQVTLTYGGTSSTLTNYVVYLNGTKNITFESIKFENTSATYTTVFYFAGNTENVTVKNSIITNNAASTTSTNNILVYSPSGSNDNNVSFLNNQMSGGSYTFYWYGASTTNRAYGFRAEGNIIDPGYYRGIYLYSQDSVILKNNMLFDTVGLYPSGYYWIYMGYNKGTFEVTGNTIGGWTNSATTAYGIYMTNAGGSTQQRGLVANNFFIFGGANSTNPFYGIYALTTGLVDFVHNNFNVTSTSATARAMFLSSGGNMRLFNNIIKINGPGTGIYAANTFLLQESDHNNIYAPAGMVGYAGINTPTLADWQTETEMDQNSFSVNPNYVSATDLHVCNDTLDGSGLNVGVLTDHDGDARNPARIDIGADQFIAANPELGADTFYCTGGSVMLGAAPVSNVGYLWNTSATTSSISANAPGTYILMTTTACGAGSDTIEVVEEDLPLTSFSHTTNYMTGIYTNTTSGGGMTYLWNFGDGQTSTLENPVHIYTNTGTYTVTLTVTNACGTATFSQQVVIAVPGFTEHGITGSMNVYPNPSTGAYRLDLSGAPEGIYMVRVSNLQGQRLYESSMRSDGMSASAGIDITRLPGGMYLLEVIGSEGRSTARIVKQ